jgi:hypothetical protein
MDNKKDVAVLYYNESTTRILLGKGDGTFQDPISFVNGANYNPNVLDAGDVNNDNKLDIVVANYGANSVSVYLGDGTGHFTKLQEYAIGTNSTPAGITLIDLNGDNILDFLVACQSGNNVDVYLGNGNGSFYYYQSYSTGNGSGPTTTIVDDFNKDGQVDFIVSRFNDNNISVYLGTGNGNFTQKATYSTGTGPYTPVSRDFNNDDILDVATSNYYDNTTSVFLGNGDGTFTLLNTLSTGTGSLPYDIDAADFNNDNIADLFVPNSGTNNVGVFLGIGTGAFKTIKTYSTGINPYVAAAGDFNQDGLTDLVTANSEAGDATVILNTCS